MSDEQLQALLETRFQQRRLPQVGPAIVADSLVKRYPSGTEAVRAISFRVEAGEVFGILGPNGAGKSTTMGILGTVVRPTGGSATVVGYDVVKQPREVRRRI